MRLAFSSLRESSCWLPAVIQLLVRKHSQDARRQRAIALKSLVVVGFVVRENAVSFFFSLPFAECIFDRALTAKNGQWSRNSPCCYPEARGLITHLSWQTTKRERKIIEKERAIALARKIYFCPGLFQEIDAKKNLNFVKPHNRIRTNSVRIFVCRRCIVIRRKADLESFFETRSNSSPYLSHSILHLRWKVRFLVLCALPHVRNFIRHAQSNRDIIRMQTESPPFGF